MVFTTPAVQIIVMTLVSVFFQVLQAYLQPWRAPLANMIDAVLSTPPSVLRALRLPKGQGVATGHLRVPPSVLRALRLPKGQGLATGHLRVLRRCYVSPVGVTGTAFAKGAGGGFTPSLRFQSDQFYASLKRRGGDTAVAAYPEFFSVLLWLLRHMSLATSSKPRLGDLVNDARRLRNGTL